MAYEQKENSGALFKNKRKESAKHPDYTGSVNVEGTEYRLAAWIKKGKKGAFMSLAVSENNGQGGQKGRNQSENTDDIPF